MNYVIVCVWRTVRPVVRALNPRPVGAAIVRRLRPRARMLLVCSVVASPLGLVPGIFPTPPAAPPAPPRVVAHYVSPEGRAAIYEADQQRATPIPSPGFTALALGAGIFAWAVYRGRK